MKLLIYGTGTIGTAYGRLEKALNAGRSLGLPMSVWGSYEKYIDPT